LLRAPHSAYAINPAKEIKLTPTLKKPPIYKILYFQVLAAVVVGVLLGHLYPSLGVDMKPFGDAFIKGIKMLIAPIIFCTVVVGIAGMEDMKKVGKILSNLRYSQDKEEKEAFLKGMSEIAQQEIHVRMVNSTLFR
jgi:hypothetical protein